MGKNRDFFKKIGDIEGTFHAKKGMMKDRHGKDITEARDQKAVARIHRRTIQKVLVTQITTMVWSFT